MGGRLVVIRHCVSQRYFSVRELVYFNLVAFQVPLFNHRQTVRAENHKVLSCAVSVLGATYLGSLGISVRVDSAYMCVFYLINGRLCL